MSQVSIFPELMEKDGSRASEMDVCIEPYTLGKHSTTRKRKLASHCLQNERFIFLTEQGRLLLALVQWLASSRLRP